MNTNTFLYIVGSACFRIGSAELQHVPPTAFNLSSTSLVPGLSIRTGSKVWFSSKKNSPQIITSNLAAHTWSIKYRQKKTNYTVRLKIAR